MSEAVELERGRAHRARLLPLLLALAAACAMPGQLYEVAPLISGTVRARDGLSREAKLVLVVMHRESLTLYDRKELALSASGEFAFPPAQLSVAGREYSKVYRVFLHLEQPDLEGPQRDRVVWRTAFSRFDLAGPIRLDCDLARPISLGQPCRVRDPLDHPWLIAEGERQFRRLCSECHGPDAAGGTSEAGATNENPMDLTRIADRWGGRFDRTEIALWIEGRTLLEAHRNRSMPIWGEQLSAKYARYAEGDALIGATLDPILVYLESRQVLGRD